MMSRKMALVFGALIGIGVGCGRPAEQRTVDLTVPVTVKPATLGTIEDLVTVTGTLRPVREAQLVSEIKGNLHWGEESGRKLSKGMTVEKGEVIARLDNQEWVVGARLESNRLASENTKKTLDQQEVLFKRGLTTDNDLQNARKAWQDAMSAYENAKIQVAKTEIVSPIRGVLSDVTDVTEGTLINQNAVVAKVVDYSEVFVDLKIPNAQIEKVAIGQPVRVTNYAFPDRIFSGEISSLDPVLDEATRTFRAVGTIKNPDLMLRPGMFVKADIVTESRKNVVMVPRTLIQRRRNQQVVFVEEEGRAQQKDVKTGLENRDSVEVVSGLEQGDQIITSNYETLRPRARVRVTGQGN